MILRIAAIASLLTLGLADAEVQRWRMSDGKVIEAEARDAWGEGDAAMVEFLTPDLKVLTVKRSEVHPDDLKRISPPNPGYEGYHFARATAEPVNGQAGQVEITYVFFRTVPGVKDCDESTLKVAPFKIGNTLIPPDAWKVKNPVGPERSVVEFHTIGAYDASKLTGSKFSASLEMEIGKERKRTIQQIDFPKRFGQEIKSTFGDIVITSLCIPPLGETAARYGVIVRSEPKEKLIRYLMESNGRTAGRGGMYVKDAGTFATVKIDYWESFEKKLIQFEGTAGSQDRRRDD